MKYYSNPYQNEVWKAQQEMNNQDDFIQRMILAVFILMMIIGCAYILFGNYE